MPINPDHFRPLRRRRMHPLHWVLQAVKWVSQATFWVLQAIEVTYWLYRGKLTFHQAWRIWSGKARLIMRDLYDEMEGGIGPH